MTVQTLLFKDFGFPHRVCQHFRGKKHILIIQPPASLIRNTMNWSKLWHLSILRTVYMFMLPSKCFCAAFMRVKPSSQKFSQFLVWLFCTYSGEKHKYCEPINRARLTILMRKVTTAPSPGAVACSQACYKENTLATVPHCYWACLHVPLAGSNKLGSLLLPSWLFPGSSWACVLEVHPQCSILS